jgi:SAM-dependent methyltransferase
MKTPRNAEWNAAEYHRLSAPQFQWGQRVLGELRLRGDECVLDAGCGTGKLTRLLLENLPRGRAVGVDLSRNMVEHARAELHADFPRNALFVVANFLARHSQNVSTEFSVPPRFTGSRITIGYFATSSWPCGLEDGFMRNAEADPT